MFLRKFNMFIYYFRKLLKLKAVIFKAVAISTSFEDTYVNTCIYNSVVIKVILFFSSTYSWLYGRMTFPPSLKNVTKAVISMHGINPQEL